MGYYYDKKKAFRKIDEMYKDGASIDRIELKISTLFGFGRKMVEQRIELLDKLNEDR
jgi:hypothetical protein